MTVCRYFLQGTCRFGDRCRFEHTASSYEQQRNVAGYHERDGHQRGQSNNYQQYNQRGQSQNYQQYNQRGNDRYEYNYNQSPRSYSENYQHPETKYLPSNYYGAQRSYSPDRYSGNYQHNSPTRYTPSGLLNNSYDSYNYYEAQRSYSPERYSDNRMETHNYGQGYEAQPLYNEHSYGRNRAQYASNNYRKDNTHGQNKYQWISNDHKKQNQQKSYNKKEIVDDSYATSTPKGKVSFSFKSSESEIKKKNSEQYPVNEKDQLHAELVKEDAKAWELGGLWPFTCYFPSPDKHAFPGFCDLSPEELRYAAYKAEENNSYDSYVQSVQNAVMQINRQRSELQIPTPRLLATLKRIWDGENLSFTPNIITSIPFIQCEDTGVDTMDAPTTVLPVGSSASSFSFKMTTETVPSSKSAASAFSFKLPPTEAKSTVTTVSAGDSDVYTPLENLTEEEKHQFSASTFVLGKIPTKPPPQVLCS